MIPVFHRRGKDWRSLPRERWGSQAKLPLVILPPPSVRVRIATPDIRRVVYLPPLGMVARSFLGRVVR